jgi:signal transduction histidine kinase
MNPHQRLIAAAILIGIAALLPTTAWYITGSREAARRADAATAAAQDRLAAEVEREAGRLGSRLEDLRTRESARPFFHYQTLYRDPRGAAEGLSVTPSPLTAGPTDPLVRGHFQIDESGEVTLPNVSERFPELTTSPDYAALCDFLTELQSGVVMTEDTVPLPATADDERVLTLTGSEWEQIALADSVYASITGRVDERETRAFGDGEIGRVVVRVRPLRWHTTIFASGPSLTALREVRTPSGVVLQGFGIASDAIADWLSGSTLSMQFLPAARTPGDAVMELVGDTGWALSASAPADLARAAAEGREIVLEFRRTFAMVAAAVVLAAAALVWLLMQTDRLARQRAHFAAAAAHELKTPLSSLLLHAEMLSEELGDPQHRSRYAATVGDEASRLSRVVSNMLDLARLERGALATTPTAGDLGEAVHRSVERSRRRLEAAGLTVRLQVPVESPRAVFDDDAVAQIVDNLLDNAEKHTRSAPSRELQVTVEDSDDTARVVFADTGPGVSRQARRTIFRPFDRPASAHRTAGLGLGLALARSLARSQGGELRLESGDGPGATFVLTLPWAKR